MARRKTTEQQIAELEERLRAAKAKQAAGERKARNHALMVMGGLVESHVPGGWRAVDWDALAAWLAAHDGELAGLTQEREDASDALARLRGWERRGRAAKASGGADGSADGGGADSAFPPVERSSVTIGGGPQAPHARRSKPSVR